MRKMRVLVVGNGPGAAVIRSRLGDDFHRDLCDLVVVSTPGESPEEEFDTVFVEAPPRERLQAARMVRDRVHCRWVFVVGKVPAEDVDIINGIFGWQKEELTVELGEPPMKQNQKEVEMDKLAILYVGAENRVAEMLRREGHSVTLWNFAENGGTFADFLGNDVVIVGTECGPEVLEELVEDLLPGVVDPQNPPVVFVLHTGVCGYLEGDEIGVCADFAIEDTFTVRMLYCALMETSLCRFPPERFAERAA